jgi:hypothetical protein
MGFVAGMGAGDDCSGEEITREKVRKLFVFRKGFVSDLNVRCA